MYKFSVIIPVYNTEKYILKCLKSITAQKLGKDFNDKVEIIVVDDGSTDNSENIIRAYQVREEKNKIFDIQYFYKKNGGLSSARNFGVEKANGEYLLFVDSDDYIDKNLLSELLEVLEKDEVDDKTDLVKFKCSKVLESGEEIERISGPIFEHLNGEDAFENLYAQDILTDPAWLYAYNKNFFVKNKFKFKKGLYHEDFGLTPLVLVKANIVTSIDFYGYYYVQTTGSSITRNNDREKSLKRANDLLKHYDNMLETIKNYDISEKTKENLKIYYTNSILLEVNNITDEEDKKAYIKEIKKRKMVNNIKARNFKQLLKKIILKISIKGYLKMRK